MSFHALDWGSERSLIEFVVVGVSLSLLFRSFQQRHPLLWLNLLAYAPFICCRCCWLFYRWQRLVVVVVVGFSSSVSSLLGVLSLTSSCCCCCCCRCCLAVIVVVVVGDVLLLLLLLAESRHSLKILVYIRLVMHATTMELQHLEKNGPAAL